MASSVLYELIGPACAKLSLYLSNSYSKDLETITDVEVVNEDGTKKSEVQILIDRIQEIQKQIPHNEMIEHEDENAFTEAAEEYNNYNQMRRTGFIRNNR